MRRNNIERLSKTARQNIEKKTKPPEEESETSQSSSSMFWLIPLVIPVALIMSFRMEGYSILERIDPVFAQCFDMFFVLCIPIAMLCYVKKKNYWRTIAMLAFMGLSLEMMMGIANLIEPAVFDFI